jgi:hypothetical protein
VGLVGSGRCEEDLVLGGEALEFEAEAGVVGLEGSGCGGEGLELCFEGFYMPLFAFAESSLSVMIVRDNRARR